MKNGKETKFVQFEFMSMGERCHGRYKKLSASAPVVLVATGGGNNGSKSETWAKLPTIFERYGISTILFDFAGQGYSSGDRRVLTLSKGVRNLQDVLSHVLKWDWVVPERLALLGSSYGGNVVLDYLASAEPVPVRGATFKSPCIDLRESYLQELGDAGMAAWEREGYSEAAGLDWKVIQDADASDLAERLGRIAVPMLITHGTTDESVPIAQVRLVRDRASGVVDLFEMKGANHHYSDRDDWDRMAAAHAAWLAQLFKK